MFLWACIVCLKAVDRFIAKEYQSWHPQRDKYLHLSFFPLREIRSQADDPALCISDGTFVEEGLNFILWKGFLASAGNNLDKDLSKL